MKTNEVIIQSRPNCSRQIYPPKLILYNPIYLFCKTIYALIFSQTILIDNPPWQKLMCLQEFAEFDPKKHDKTVKLCDFLLKI